jgi:hypothetical protein
VELNLGLQKTKLFSFWTPCKAYRTTCCVEMAQKGQVIN